MNTQFQQQFSRLPPELQAVAGQQFEKLQHHDPALCQQLNETQQAQLKCCFALSDFIAESCIYLSAIVRHVFIEDDPLYRPIGAYPALIRQLDEIVDETDFVRAIRQMRKSLMVNIGVNDVLKRHSISDSFTRISQLSDRLILCACRRAYHEVAKVNGQPLTADGTPIPLSILAMGKLGGEELNFSSDIDLIFCYALGGQTVGGRKSIDHQLFFTRVAQKLIYFLDHHNADGFVFRVDMRLRPFGDSGPLVLSFAAMEDYYQAQGRDWERYAMLKGRVIGEGETTPDAVVAQGFATELTALLNPFVYRRYIDFGVIESLRKMKLMISQEARRKATGLNIKLGLGGIREVEFIAQVLQLIRGGREKVLQVRPLLLALVRLKDNQALNDTQYHQLSDSYLRLRQCEHYLQVFNDRQTQLLPEDEVNRQRLTWLLDCADWPECVAKINQVMKTVHDEFIRVIDDSRQENGDQPDAYELLWQFIPAAPQDAPYPGESSGESLEENPEQAQQLELLSWLTASEQLSFAGHLAQFKAEVQKSAIGGRGREVLDRLLPKLLQVFEHSKEGVETLERVFRVLLKIAGRTVYLELLDENGGALKQLVKLCAQSDWIVEQLSYQPILLDELIDTRVLYHPTEPKRYRQLLSEYMMRVPAEDLEQQLEYLRHFKLSHQLRIAAADISSVLSVAQVSGHLSAVAEAVVDCVVNIAWQQMVGRYGEPTQGSSANKGFGVIAYGKLGGSELGYGSDLDVVFVHDCDSSAVTNGKKAIDSRQFYLKLAQRVVHIFTTRTVSGVLYEMDTRLRPSGNSGLMAINIKRYGDYLAEEAWTWEHQALVRSRMVYGGDKLTRQFDDIRRDILMQPRDQVVLRDEVVSMRAKMRDHLSRDRGMLFDLKQGLGGIADIEFITQFLVLAHSARHPVLIRSCANSELFELFARQQIITEQQAQILRDGYHQLREVYHRLTLQQQDKLTDSAQVQSLSVDIQQIWAEILLV